MSLIHTLKSESIKTKRGATLYFTLIAAALVPIILLINFFGGEISAETRKDTFNAVFKVGFEIATIAIFPMFIVIVCTLLPQIEYRNNTWKQVFSSPQKLSDVFIAKFLHVQSLIILFLFAFNVFMIVVLFLANAMDPSLDVFGKQVHWSTIGNKNLDLYLAVLGISAIQFWMGLRFRNFLIPLGIGFAGWIGGNLMLLEFENLNAKFFPYAYTAFTAFPRFNDMLPTIQTGSALYAFVILLLAFLDFSKKLAK
jgi:lantibiotic transport system permease protein